MGVGGGRGSFLESILGSIQSKLALKIGNNRNDSAALKFLASTCLLLLNGLLAGLIYYLCSSPYFLL